ncbi:response regulator transcription factor [Tenggerimyces flavus]|uniref:Response regulator n=1 Tax=Tenggerimyces flavus TaxID=1708749 RepID=A0ABV7YLF1_9ACTN|nr:response regulator transcription factor [Tenggerimyces flavus]MBM7787654.1 DNA-binding NarL/FixJ family response regulator [Tenggerimyces flavus]
MTVRIVVAEDSLLVREGIGRLLDSQPDFEVVALCADLPELLAAVPEQEPDVVVTDVRMPPTNTDEGIQAATQLRTTHPSVGVVVLSQYAEPGYATPLLAAGSGGRAYLLKERVSDPAQLASAVRTVVAGGSVIDPVVVEALVADSRQARPTPMDALSPREREVLAGIAEGKSNAAVAAGLFLSERAVEKHINALFGKLGLAPERDVNRRVMAVLLYLSDR